MASDKNDLVTSAPPLGMIADPKHNDIMHVEGGIATEDVADAKRDIIRSDAIRAEEAERKLSLRESLRLYPKALGWSLAISLVIVMEGYDLACAYERAPGATCSRSVLGGLIGVGEYRKKYGQWSGEEHGYQLTAAWQAAIGQASTIGCFL